MTEAHSDTGKESVVMGFVAVDLETIATQGIFQTPSLHPESTCPPDGWNQDRVQFHRCLVLKPQSGWTMFQLFVTVKDVGHIICPENSPMVLFVYILNVVYSKHFRNSLLPLLFLVCCDLSCFVVCIIMD